MFSSILPVAGNNEGGNGKSQQINTWLQAWCHQQNLGFFDHGLVFMKPALLVTDGVHLAQRGKDLCTRASGAH